MEYSQDKENQPLGHHDDHHGGKGGGNGTKRDRTGHPKKTTGGQHHPPAASSKPDIPRNAYTTMFEGFRDEIDEHHARRERVIKVSRDVTALSKKMIFSLLRTNTLGQPLPPQLDKEFRSRLADIKALLAPIVADVQGLNRFRYQIRGLEEYAEAVCLYHYVRYQTLITPRQAAELLGPEAEMDLTTEEYLGGVFDLFGEMMRFATNMAGMCGTLSPPAGAKKTGTGEGEGEGEMDVDVDVDVQEQEQMGRSILSDMQELGSCVEILPIFKGAKDMRWKIDTMRSSVQKVEKLGYGLVVRVNERPTGWMPDLSDDRGAEIQA